MIYVFAIKDPRLTAQGKPDIVYIGSGRQPWLSVVRHLRESSNWDLYDWSKGLFEDFPEGVDVLGQEVCDIYHGEVISIPPPAEGRTRVEWVILGLDQEPIDAELASTRAVIPLGTQKAYWINRLRAEGQPLLNGRPGRPRKAAGET